MTPSRTHLVAGALVGLAVLLLAFPEPSADGDARLAALEQRLDEVDTSDVSLAPKPGQPVVFAVERDGAWTFGTCPLTHWIGAPVATSLSAGDYRISFTGLTEPPICTFGGQAMAVLTENVTADLIELTTRTADGGILDPVRLSRVCVGK